MIYILHDPMYLNPRNCGSIEKPGCCRIYIISSSSGDLAGDPLKGPRNLSNLTGEPPPALGDRLLWYPHMSFRQHFWQAQLT